MTAQLLIPGVAPVFKRTLVDTGAKLSTLLGKLANVDRYGFDTESNGPLLVGLRGKKSMVNVYRSRLAGMSFAFDDHTSYYVPIEHRQGNLPAFEHQRLASAVFGVKATGWIHNAKHEAKAMARMDNWRDLGYGTVSTPRWRCTQVGCWLAGAESGVEKRPFALKTLAPRYLDIQMTEFDATTGGMDFGQLLPKDGLNYACEDAEAALRLGVEVVTPRLQAQDLMGWYESVEMPFLFLLRTMEDNGMALDRAAHGRSVEELARQAQQLADDWSWLTDGSIASPKQLAKLYEDGIWDATNVPRKKTGPSTEAEYIAWQLDRCPPGSLGYKLAAIKGEYATLQKLVSTYGLKMLALADQYPDGRLHTSFLQTGTATGRLSSSYPNLQNIPKRTPLGKRVRDAFVPAPGHVFVSADYSQIELRVLAHFAGKGLLFDGYRGNIDVHQQTADLMGVARPEAKNGNFAVIYGAGAARLAKTLGVTVEECKDFLSRHRELHGPVYEVLDRMREAGRERGSVRTFAGRRRAVNSRVLSEQLEALRARGARYATSAEFRELWYLLGKEDRIARNTPIQGGAADIVKLGMLEAARVMPGNMVCQIHDDLLYEVPEDRPEEAMAALKGAMEGAGERFGFRVPLVAEPASGARWSDL